MKKKLALSALVAAALSAAAAAPASAKHSWADYHWARASNPFVLTLDNNLTTGNWDSLGRAVSTDWSKLMGWDRALTTSLTSQKSDNRRCKPSSGRVEVCNGKYGYNGWLGLASVWTSGGHIVQGTTKVNDTYLASSSYSQADRQHVLCQEVGHTFGLDHQDESGADLDTCMDYAKGLDNPSPNFHDWEWLDAPNLLDPGPSIYSHLDSTTTVSSTSAASGNKGQLKRIKDDVYVEDLGQGKKRFVFVLWKDEAASDAAPSDRVPE